MRYKGGLLLGIVLHHRAPRVEEPLPSVSPGEQQEKIEPLDALAVSLLVEEYKSIRDESLRSLSYAGTTIRWAVGLYGVMFSAGIGLLTLSAGSPLSADVALLLFGLVIPCVTWVSSWNWLGEVRRSQRAGAYVRRRERQIANIPGIDHAFGFAPLNWESYLAGGESGSWHKTLLPYLPLGAGFCGATLVSIAVFVMEWQSCSGQHSCHAATWVFWCVIGLEGLFAAFTLVLAFLGVYRLGRDPRPRGRKGH
ncbi:MAG: hypothetical protein LBJ02_08105 [Bifidobacteriaceae bacterium]|jgi:hypothetical protein|nr:hypothetical protein [Bifidobacteriaceae bacterium]